VETTQGITNHIKIINDKKFNEEDIKPIKPNNNLSIININNDNLINFKKEMSEYYKLYTESYSKKDKNTYFICKLLQREFQN
jgi:hypothetical protein